MTVVKMAVGETTWYLEIEYEIKKIDFFINEILFYFSASD